MAVRAKRPEPSNEALARFPSGGEYDGHLCICTDNCPVCCDGGCGCEACLRAWIDAGLDELIGWWR